MADDEGRSRRAGESRRSVRARRSCVFVYAPSDGTFDVLWFEVRKNGRDVGELAQRAQHEYEVKGWTIEPPAPGGVGGAIVKPLQTRRHGNGQVAEVNLKRDGQFYAYSRATNTPELDISYGHEARSLLHAQQVADYLAHAGCDGVRCGGWQDAHHDDPECLAALEREASTSLGFVG